MSLNGYHLLRYLRQNRLRISIITSVVFHFFGVLGIGSAYKDWFLRFTPVVLLCSITFLFWNIKNHHRKIWQTFMLVFFLGFVAEWIGVHTGVLFGSYFYGESLGPKFWGVPFSIAANWAALCMASAFLIQNFNLPPVAGILAAATVPVAIDFCIEPLCSLLDFWYWQNQNVPVSNYITWYGCSLVFVRIFYPKLRQAANRFACYFIFIQFIFFIVLNGVVR